MGIIDMLHLVQEVARELGREIAFFASPWSPPPWMKTSGRLIGGTLKEGYAGELARYLRQFVEAYEAEGIPIAAITLQNEPNFTPGDYPGMRLTWEQERDLTVATYEELHDTSGGKTKTTTQLWINDHNFEHWTNADEVLSSLAEKGKKHYVNAVAFHNYSDSPASNASCLRERHPDTDIVFTEHSEWGTSGMFNIQEYFWNWSRSYVYWVTMTTRDLDERNQGPYNTLGALSPTLLIEDDPAGHRWYRTPEFYLLGQFSRFVQPGALRIGCDRGSPEAVTAVCFLNPDQTVVLVAVNQTEEEQRSCVLFQGRQVVTRLPSGSVGTLVWRRDE
jgi:O-glycosyl hydrolase